MSVFNHYARYYDLIYRDKDYRGEADYVHALIQSRAPGARKILNLGCGSGRHDRHLAELGYDVTGIDLSEEMLACARAAAAGTERLRFLQGDVRTLSLGENFDAVISLFHVMSYQTENEDLAGAFTTAFSHLKPGGLFLFDCWYGPGVLTDRPQVRVKDLEDDAISVTRIATPTMHAERNLVDVGYRIFIRDKVTDAVQEVSETHRMRYLFTPELKLFLSAAGFQSVTSSEWLTSSPLDFTSWNAVIAAQKSAS